MSVVLLAKKIRNFVAVMVLVAVGLFLSSSHGVHAQPANITLTADDSIIQIDWDETSPNPVYDYTFEVSFDNGANWSVWPHTPSNDQFIQMPRSANINLYDLVFKVRVTTQFVDSSSSAPVVADVTLPAYYQSSAVFSAGAASVMVTDTERKSHGLNWWVDNTMGFFEYNGKIISLSANGPNTARIELGETDFIGTVTNTSTPLQNEIINSDHASGGPLYYDAASNRLLMFYHGELHTPSATNFYSYLGMAASTDGGVTFEDLGQIIRPNLDIASPNRIGGVDVGSGPYVVRDGYFYVYFKDARETDGSNVNMAVARASVADVLAAAANGTVASWQKYYNGSFSESGIGGASDDIMANYPYIAWSDTAYIESLNKFVMVFSNYDAGTWNHMITTSTNGIDWSKPEKLYDTPSSNEMLYLTISSPDFANQRVITGDHFYLFRTVSTTAGSGDRWEDAWLERLTVSFAVPSNGGGSADGQSGGGDASALADTGVSQVGILGLACITAFCTALYLLRRITHLA